VVKRDKENKVDGQQLAPPEFARKFFICVGAPAWIRRDIALPFWLRGTT